MRKYKYNQIVIALAAILFLFGCSPNNKNIEDENENAGMKSDTSKPKENPYANAEVEIKIFKNDTLTDSLLQGYGYDIYIFKSRYVHQPHIPAINGNRGFDTKADARKTAEFIVYKIRNNIMPPSVTVQELDSLDILR